jgi:hypothetical protein
MAIDTTFDALVHDLRRLVEKQVMPSYNWYSSSKGWPRVIFRCGGVMVVMGSLALPVISSSRTIQSGDRELLLTIVSLAVAAFSSLNTFFRWDGMWRSRTRTAYQLQGMLARWELQLKASEFADHPAVAALEATDTLFKGAFALTSSETDEFFSGVKPPEVSR